MRDRPCARRPCSVFGLLFGGSTPCGVCGADPLAHCRAPNWPASKFSGSVGAIQRQTGAACPPPAGPLPPRTRTGRKLRSWWMPSGGRMTRSSLGCGRSAGPPHPLSVWGQPRARTVGRRRGPGKGPRAVGQAEDLPPRNRSVWPKYSAASLALMANACMWAFESPDSAHRCRLHCPSPTCPWPMPDRVTAEVSSVQVDTGVEVRSPRLFWGGRNSRTKPTELKMDFELSAGSPRKATE